MESEECASGDPVAQYLRADGEWKGGVRPASVIERPEDIVWLVAHTEKERPFVVCRWCGSKRQIRNVREGVLWFGDHPCSYGLAA